MPSGRGTQQPELVLVGIRDVPAAEHKSVRCQPEKLVVVEVVGLEPRRADGGQHVELLLLGLAEVEMDDVSRPGVVVGTVRDRHHRADHGGHGQRGRSEGDDGTTPDAACPGVEDGAHVRPVGGLGRDGPPQRFVQIGAHAVASLDVAAELGRTSSSPPRRAYAVRRVASPRAVWLFTVPVRHPSASATASTLRSS